MKLVLTKHLLLAAALLLAGTACTNETENGLSGNPPSPSEEDGTRREVLLTIKNKLSVAEKGTKSIATAPENKISSLDVYVFGSDTEDGTYTYQERFAYRETPADLPDGATALTITQEGDGKEASTTMKLKKGLFVKLYAIANQPELVDPSGTTGTGTAVGATGKLMQPADFTPLVLTSPGESGTPVQAAGSPTLADFLTFHSPLLDAATAADILETPLPMSGAHTIPVDLTDFEGFSRLQAGFKLTRTVARFDIVNNSAESRFTITDISMGSARKGVSFFPVTALGTAPTDLITMPTRTFTGMDNANTGTTISAFYSYPSPKDDDGYLILTGTYKMNETDPERQVSYQIPFKQDASGTGSYIEVSQNHRYTIAITKADDYHIDFNLTVADWDDAGDLDPFDPAEPAEPVLPISFNVTIGSDPDLPEFYGSPEKSESGDSIRLTIKGGTVTFTITDTRDAQPVPVVTVTQDKYNNDEDWWEISPVTTKSNPLSKADSKATYEFTATIEEFIDNGTSKDQVNIAHVDIKWGEGADETKRFSVSRGFSFLTYMDERTFPEIENHTPQTIRLSVMEGGGYIWAPCNCGASGRGSYATNPGLLFQWGRKTPFKHENEANDLYEGGNLPASAAASYENGFMNKFIPNNNGDYSWLPTSTDGIEKLWNLGTEDNPIKNKANDPCPEGWRVPTKKELSIVEGSDALSADGSSKYGYLLALNIVSVGKRDEQGTSASGQYSGYSWTSLYSNEQANGLYFEYHGSSTSEIRPYNLSNAFAIRCIKE